jgi:LPS export ABC transporter protein LptC
MPEYSGALPDQRLPGEGGGLQRARFYLLCALLTLLAGAGVLLFGAGHWRQELGDLKNMLPANVDMRLGRLTLNEAGENGQTMTIEAASALYNQAEDSFLLEGGVRARVVHGPDDYDITSAAGHYDQAKKTITLIGEVKVVESSGRVLTSERLVMEFEAGRLISESPFCYADPESDLEGSAFVYHTHDRTLVMEGPVRLMF